MASRRSSATARTSPRSWATRAAPCCVSCFCGAGTTTRGRSWRPTSGRTGAASAAKYNLRYTLWKIKKSTDTGEGGRSLIKLDREYCCIDRAYDYICDLQTIDEIDPETRSADELKRACDAFGGELLEGYYFNHCEDLNELILSQRIYYEKRKNRLLMKAAELYEQRDMLPEAVGILERVMEYEPYNEQLALRLMTLYERGGDRSRAIRFFNEFRNRLASNLEIYPGSAITQKYAELKAAPAAPEPAPAADSVPGLHVRTYCLRRCPASGWRTRWGSCWTPSGTTCGRTTGRCCGCWGLYSPLRRRVPVWRARSRPRRRRWPRRLSGGSPVWAARQPLAVHIRRAGEMDDVSRGVLEYLLAERPAGLTLLTEDGCTLGDMPSGK